MIAWQVLALSSLFSFLWGAVVLGAAHEYRKARAVVGRKRPDLVRALRVLVLAFCAFATASAYLFRTALVLAGYGDILAGQLVFYSLLGTNALGSLFCIVSMWYD